MSWAAVIIAGAAAATKLTVGGIQYAKGRKLAKEAVRPTYEVPSAVNDQLAIAKAQAQNNRLPGQSQAESNISGASQTGIRAAKESGNPAAIMAAISAINANQNQAYQGLATKGAEFQQQNIANLQNTLGNYGQYQDRQFDMNKMQPFRDKAAAAAALQGAGMKNMAGGASDGGGIAMQAMGKKDGGGGAGSAKTSTIESGVPTAVESAPIGTSNFTPSQINQQKRAELSRQWTLEGVPAGEQYNRFQALGL